VAYQANICTFFWLTIASSRFMVSGGSNLNIN
jgi:hypothetical protein